MSAAMKPRMDLEAFLEWESRQEFKYEFDGFQPVAMAGVSSEHAAIQANLMLAVGSRLRGGPCRIFGSDLKIAAAGSIRYPDAFVVCTPVPRGTLVVENPVVVFEILSPGTSYRDRIEKNREYRATPSIQRYVILEQTRPAATVFSRVGDEWVADIVIGETELALPEVGLTIPLPELYEGVEPPPETEQAEAG
jgi:Uma2 family endonuclease